MPESRQHAETSFSELRQRLAPEARALLCCARADLDAGRRSELRALASAGLDYAQLVRQAERHGLTPLLFRHLQVELGQRCPPEVLAQLASRTQLSTARGLAMCAELGELLPALAARGVDCRVVKGPVSAVLCYRDVGLRVFTDLDVLVREADAPALGEVLAARGYVPHLSLERAQQHWLLQTDHELMWRHPDLLRLVDVHWSLMPRGYSFTPDDAGPFSARSTVRLGALPVPTLGLEATLLFLLLHGMKHDFDALGWLCDIAELVRNSPALDWDAVLDWSAPQGRRRFIDIGLMLVHGLLDAPVPGRVLARGCADRQVARFAVELGRGLFRPESGRGTALEAAFGLAYFRAMALRSDRLRYVHDTLLRPTSHEWQALPLPDALRPLYYLIRPTRLLVKYLRPGRRE